MQPIRTSTTLVLRLDTISVNLGTNGSRPVTMRFLCFHGMGMNGKVFEKQTEKLRQALGRGHDFVFLTGTIPTNAAPGFDSLAGESYRFLGRDSEQNLVLLNSLMQVIRDLGPFDGVMGFSEGGGVAAGLLLEDTRNPFAHFKCGIFFCAAQPFDPEGATTVTNNFSDAEKSGVVLNIPTAHIWSSTGDVFPSMGRELVPLCNSSMREEFVHDLGHQVPGFLSNDGLYGAARAIERTIERAKI